MARAVKAIEQTGEGIVQGGREALTRFAKYTAPGMLGVLMSASKLQKATSVITRGTAGNTAARYCPKRGRITLGRKPGTRSPGMPELNDCHGSKLVLAVAARHLRGRRHTVGSAPCRSAACWAATILAFLASLADR
jgi:hypothetical protein